MGSLQNPRKWRYTWETLAHLPTLRLFLFTHEIKPLNQCKNLKVSLNFEDLLLLVTWLEEIKNPVVGSFDFSVKVPVPRVLVDLSSPVDFKAMEDHIEVKLVLLLPVDHPLFMNFDSDLNISDKKPNGERETFEPLQSLSGSFFVPSFSTLIGEGRVVTACLTIVQNSYSKDILTAENTRSVSQRLII